MIAAPIKRDIVIPQGTSFPITLKYKDSNGDAIDITGASCEMQLRKTLEQTTPDLTCTIANGKAFVNGSNQFGVTLTPADTASLDATTYYYDIELTLASSDVTRVMEGKATITREVTR